MISTVSCNTYRGKNKAKMINQYKIIKTLGKGSFATVRLCQDNKTRDYYAIKVMNKNELKKIQIGRGRNAFDCVVDELKVMKRLEHSNVSWLHEIIDDPKNEDIYLVTEFHSKGSLQEQIEKGNKHI